MERVKLNITGMTCVNCAGAITRTTSKIPGVKSVVINLADNSGIFELDGADVASIKAKIKKLGYGVASDYAELERAELAYVSNLKRKLAIAAVLAALIMAGEMSGISNLALKIALFTLASVAIFWCGADFYRHGIASLKSRNYDMNVLVMLGTLSAYAYSLIALIAPGVLPEGMRYLYFSGPAMIITFVLLGKFLEEKSKRGARNYLKNLTALNPASAYLVRADGTTQKVSASELKVGDTVMVKSGYIIPADGVVVEGGAEIDSSALSGESLPVFKSVGDKVFAGTTNVNGYLTIKVEKGGADTLLAQVLELLLSAGATKMPIARLADKAANIFVPAVVSIAAITFAIWAFFDPWRGALAAVCVLIISCPCALGLATPIAVVSGISAGAKEGILVKNPAALEIMGKTGFAVFDKTGTLTKGEISAVYSNLNASDLREVAALEALGSHPISRAIVEFAGESVSNLKLDPLKFENIPGMGVAYDEGEILAGNEALFEKFGVALPASANDEPKIKESLQNGAGLVFVALNHEYKGFIVLSDTLKEGAEKLISNLKSRGVTPVILTGDREQTARALAAKSGVERVEAGLLPNEKFALVEELKKNSKVLFVGDGINDAPSLKAADAGLAMSSGSDLAKDAGDVILIRSDLASVGGALALADATVRVIKQNLAWAFVYNLVCIPLAAGALYPIFGLALTPSVGAAAMSVSSFSVVLNSLRLRRFKFE